MPARIKFKLYFFTAIAFICIGCAQTYYVSPMYGNSMPYHSLPLQKDSIKNSLYASGAIMLGGANYKLHDDVYSLQLNIYNANQFSLLKLWYGGGIILGDYVVHRFDSAFSSSIYINAIAGDKFFGSLNGNGGLAIALPVSEKTEWRILGVQATVQKEFGKYLDFRKKIVKDSISVSGISTSSILGTIGFSTEFVFKTRSGAFSIFGQYNILTGREYKYNNFEFESDLYPSLGKRYFYWSNTYAYSFKNITAYLQGNKGRRMMNFQIGMNYKLTGYKKNNVNKK